jgi:hypothetical protein
MAASADGPFGDGFEIDPRAFMADADQAADAAEAEPDETIAPSNAPGRDT